MIAISDYEHYYSDNLSFINNLKNNNFMLYERLKDVIYSLDFIAKNYEKYEHHESGSDFEEIFEIGFSYFHSQLEQIKIYYNDYFKKDLILFKKYDALVNLVLYIDDFIEALKEQEYYTNERKEVLKEVFDNIEEILSKKLEWAMDDYEDMNNKISSCVPFKVDITTTQELFSKVAEEIMIIKG